MKSIILVSHGTMARGVYKAAKMICGELKSVDYLCLEENMGIENFKKKLNGLINNSKNSDEIIVLADLKGGSPYTAAVTLISDEDLLNKSTILSGLNLPMLLTTLFFKEKLGEDEVKQIISEAKNGIDKFELEEDDIEDI